MTAHRCRLCEQIYKLYTGTVFQQRHSTPMQVVLLVRGMCKGELTTCATLAAELGASYNTVLDLRRALQANAEWMQPGTPGFHCDL